MLSRQLAKRTQISKYQQASLLIVPPKCFVYIIFELDLPMQKQMTCVLHTKNIFMHTFSLLATHEAECRAIANVSNTMRTCVVAAGIPEATLQRARPFLTNNIQTNEYIIHNCLTCFDVWK